MGGEKWQGRVVNEIIFSGNHSNIVVNRTTMVRKFLKITFWWGMSLLTNIHNLIKLIISDFGKSF